MTTDDNRSRAAGGYAASGRYNADTEDLGYGSQSSVASDSSMYDDAGYSSPTTSLGGSRFDNDDDDFSSAFDEPDRRVQWHGGVDLGLLVLRIALGGMFVVHGLDKMFGWFTDFGGMGAIESLLRGYGYTEPTILAWVLAVGETLGGALLVLGLFTPAAAGMVLAVLANTIAVKGDWNVFLGGVELELVYAAIAFALLFTGPGRASIDRNTHWCRKAPIYGIIFLVIAAGASAVTLFVLR